MSNSVIIVQSNLASPFVFLCTLSVLSPVGRTSFGSVRFVPLTFEKVPPTRSQPPLEATEGEEIVFEAAAIAQTRPVFEWSGPGGAIPSTDRVVFGGGNLRLSNVRLEDAGVYRVIARASGKDITSFTHLLVHSKSEFQHKNR